MRKDWKQTKFYTELRTVIYFIFNPRFLLCFGLAWLITNGWSYILMAIGTYFQIKWMVAVAGAYLAFLWIPISPEKIATFAIAIFLLRLLFPKDTKTLAVLRNFYEKAENAFKAKRQQHREKKQARQESEKEQQ